MTLTRQDTIAARNAIALGDHAMLERYLREGPARGDTFNITASAVTLDRAQHSGKVITINAATTTLTLPSATGSQDLYRFYVATAATSQIIKVGRSADTMVGVATMATLAGTTTFIDGIGSTDDTLTMNSGTTGGLVGSYIEMTDIVANIWMVTATLIGAGTQATAFSATV